MRIKAAGKTQWGPTFTDKVPEILSRAYGPIVYAQIIRTPWNQTRGKILNCLIIVQFFANLLCQKCSRFRNAKKGFKSPRRTVKTHPYLTGIGTENIHIAACLGFTEKSSIWPRLLVGYIAANGWLVTASHMWHQKEKGYSPLPETFPGEKLQHTSVNILDLKILQVFFKNRGEILVL